MARDAITALSDDAVLTPELALHIAELWRHPSVQQAYRERFKFQLNDSAKYFFDQVLIVAVQLMMQP